MSYQHNANRAHHSAGVPSDLNQSSGGYHQPQAQAGYGQTHPQAHYQAQPHGHHGMLAARSAAHYQPQVPRLSVDTDVQRFASFPGGSLLDQQLGGSHAYFTPSPSDNISPGAQGQWALPMRGGPQPQYTHVTPAATPQEHGPWGYGGDAHEPVFGGDSRPASATPAWSAPDLFDGYLAPGAPGAPTTERKASYVSQASAGSSAFGASNQDMMTPSYPAGVVSRPFSSQDQREGGQAMPIQHGMRFMPNDVLRTQSFHDSQSGAFPSSFSPAPGFDGPMRSRFVQTNLGSSYGGSYVQSGGSSLNYPHAEPQQHEYGMHGTYDEWGNPAEHQRLQQPTAGSRADVLSGRPMAPFPAQFALPDSAPSAGVPIYDYTAGVSKSYPPQHQLQSMGGQVPPPGADATAFLVQCIDSGMAYRDVKTRYPQHFGNVPESTLRGRVRNFKLSKEERPRKPHWTPQDDLLLRQRVAAHIGEATVRSIRTEADLNGHKIEWGKIGLEMRELGSSFKYAPKTAKKRYIERWCRG